MNQPASVFLSYEFGDLLFVQRVHSYLRRQPGLNVFFYEWHRHADRWPENVRTGLRDADHFVFFRGSKVGVTQRHEAIEWSERKAHSSISKRFIVELPNPGDWPDPGLRTDEDQRFRSFTQGVAPLLIRPLADRSDLGETEAAHCAAELARSLLGKWIPHDGLPEQYIFDYEKRVIAEFLRPNGRPDEPWLKAGCPETWPHVERRQGPQHANPLHGGDVGGWRQPDDTVLVDVRSKYHHRHATREKECCLVEKGLTFPEAGPRQNLLHGKENLLNVGIIVVGGISPGINAVIAGIVDRHRLYWRGHLRQFPECRPKLVIHGYRDGFAGLLGGRCHRIQFLQQGYDDPQSNRELGYVMENANSGGSMFGTSRYEPLSDMSDLESRNNEFDCVLSCLWTQKIDILYVIGGDGGLKAAHALHVLNKRHLQDSNPQARAFSVIGIPKTMDNDILWVWQSFGFLSAVEKASDCLRSLHTEASSNPRLSVIQLFGSDSGFTVSHAALASLLCDAALIPEMKFDMESLFAHVRKRLEPRYAPMRSESPFGIILMSETAVPEDWFYYVRWADYLRARELTVPDFVAKFSDIPQLAAMRQIVGEPNEGRFTVNLEAEEVDAIISFVRSKRRVYGQTPDPLRTVSLKLVSRILQQKIRTIMGGTDPFWQTFRVFTNEPRHLLRAAPPSCNDINTGRRFGTLAVDNAMAGYTDFMISQWLTEYVLVPLPLVVLGRKRVPSEGIFWKSVLAKTEQPENLVTASRDGGADEGIENGSVRALPDA